MRPEPPQAASAAAVAAVRGVPPLQVVLDWMAAEGGAHDGMIFDAGLPTCMLAH